MSKFRNAYAKRKSPYLGKRELSRQTSNVKGLSLFRAKYGNLIWALEVFGVMAALAAFTLDLHWRWTVEHPAITLDRVAFQEERQARKRARLTEAWALLGMQMSGNTGKGAALVSLAAENGSFPPGINLSCEQFGEHEASKSSPVNSSASCSDPIILSDVDFIGHQVNVDQDNAISTISGFKAQHTTFRRWQTLFVQFFDVNIRGARIVSSDFIAPQIYRLNASKSQVLSVGFVSSDTYECNEFEIPINCSRYYENFDSNSETNWVSTIQDSTFEGALLNDVTFENLRFFDVSFRDSIFEEVSFLRNKSEGVDISGAYLCGKPSEIRNCVSFDSEYQLNGFFYEGNQVPVDLKLMAKANDFDLETVMRILQKR